MKPSKIGIGTFKIANKKKYNSKDIENFFIYSLNSGVNLFDTSDSYEKGYIEKQIGHMLSNKSFKRNQILISTKFGQGIGYSLKDVKKSLDKSLSRLKTEYIDYYFFHSGNNKQFDNDELWTFLNKKKEQGVIKNLGLSLKNEYLINLDLFQISKSRVYGIDALSLVYNYNFRKFEKITKMIKEFEIFSRVPLSKGSLTHYNNPYSFKKKFIDSNKYISQIPAIKNLHWVMNNKFITSTLVGFSSFEQLALNILAYKTYNEKI